MTTTGDHMTDDPDHPRPSRGDTLVDRALSLAVVDGDSRATSHTKRLINGALWFSLLFPWPLVVQLLEEGAALAALSVAMSFVSSALVLLVMWRRRRCGSSRADARPDAARCHPCR